MNETNSKRNKKIFYIILIIGLLFLLIGVYNLLNYRSYIVKGEKINARIVNILEYPDSNDDLFEEELEHYKELLQSYKDKGIIKENVNVAIIINFEYNSESYEKELGYFSNNLHIGQLVTIYVKDKNPNNFIYEGKNKFSIYAALIIGIGLCVLSTISLLIILNNDKAKKYLMLKGKKLKAKVLYCDENEKIEKFNRHPYVLTCAYNDSNEELYFTSDSTFLTNPIDYYIDKYVYVYVDKSNNKNYYVDVNEFLEK